MGANAYTSRGRSVRYLIRFSADEKRALDARAASEGKPLADLIRGALGLAEAPTVHAGEPFRCAACGLPSDAPIHTGGHPTRSHAPTKSIWPR